MKETKDRYLTKSQFEIYIKEHHGERIYLPYFAKADNIFYACGDDILLSHSPSIKSYLLKINREAVLHDWEVTEKRKNYNPLTQFNLYLENFTADTRQKLLNELWKILQMPNQDIEKMNDQDIKKMDTKLNKLSEEYVYDNLPLHLAVFCGERMKFRLGGGVWEIREDTVFGTKKHTFVGKDGKEFERDVIDKMNVVRVDKTPLFVTPIDKTKVDFVFKIIKNLNEYGKTRLHLMIGI